MQKSAEEFTVNEARNILKDMAISQIGNDRFIRKNVATEKVIFAMVKFADERATLATTSLQSEVTELKARIKELETGINTP